jgi:RNA polymerase sigma factor (sigma-70 family)
MDLSGARQRAGPKFRSRHMHASTAMTQAIDPFACLVGHPFGRPVERERAAVADRYSDLMRAAQHGDRAAYSALLHGILPLLQRLVRRRLRFLQAADQEDLVQEILLSVHAGRASYDPSRPFMPWLQSIAHRRMVDRARRFGRTTAREQLIDDFADSIADQPGPEASQFGDPEALRRAVQLLPTRQRTAIELLKLRELSLNEASKVSGIGISALKVSVHRAIKKLRHSLA